MGVVALKVLLSRVSACIAFCPLTILEVSVFVRFCCWADEWRCVESCWVALVGEREGLHVLRSATILVCSFSGREPSLKVLRLLQCCMRVGGWRDLVSMSEMLALEETPPILQRPST